MELYDAFEKAREKKEKEIKVEGRTDYETRKKQEKSKLEEEKYDHLLNIPIYITKSSKMFYYISCNLLSSATILHQLMH